MDLSVHAMPVAAGPDIEIERASSGGVNPADFWFSNRGLRVNSLFTLLYKFILLFGRNPILSSRPCALAQHGAQAQVKDGAQRRPKGLSLTGRAPC